MPAITSNYADTRDVAVNGAIANTEPNVLISRTVETAAGIGFGKPVNQGAADHGCKVTAGTAAILGVTVMDRSTSDDTFAEDASARIMTKGVIWVTAGEAVAAGDPVYVTASSGAWKKTEASNVAVPNARYDTSAANGELVALRLA